ncbi:MAG: tRNA-dihydrouridine synthase family protein [Desulfocapsaceae bacterium]|nr:tRNA-dihydrouridine synthase family protein [Desulfocapsaceae bacterium]
MTDQPFLYLAPIRGITYCLFRNLFQHHFGGFDQAVAPFVNPQPHSPFDPKQLRDLQPEENKSLPVVPQFLHTEINGLLSLAQRLHDLGYTHINWNLGCPAPMVTRKRRGSGLLPYPEAITSLLDQILPKLPMQLSIKTRLGLNHKDELATLLPRLNDYPLKEIIIHTRLGKQLYKGSTDPESFGHCLELSRHQLVYNGDITDSATFHGLQKQFPTVQRWMIGRGVLADPFLARTIKGEQFSPEQRTAMLISFHQELYAGYKKSLAGPSHLLGRMKQIWFYLAASFPGQQKIWKKIKKASTEEHYLAAIDIAMNSFSTATIDMLSK